MANQLVVGAGIGAAQDRNQAVKEFFDKLVRVRQSGGNLLYGLAAPFSEVESPKQRELLLDAISIIERANVYSAPGLGQLGGKIQKTTAGGLRKHLVGGVFRAGATDLASLGLQGAGAALMPMTGGMSLPAFYAMSVLANLGLNAPTYEQEQSGRIEVLLSHARATGAVLSSEGRDYLNLTKLENDQYALNAALPFKFTKELKDTQGKKIGAAGIGYRRTGQDTLSVGISDWNTLPAGTILSRWDVLDLMAAINAPVQYKPAKSLDSNKLEERATIYFGAERGNPVLVNPLDSLQRYRADTEANTYLQMLDLANGSPLRQAVLRAISRQHVGKDVATFQPGTAKA
ncbi:MAG: hypothetical protein ACK5QX_05880, partial [bacterium]